MKSIKKKLEYSYKILGVSKDTSQEEIKKRYRTLALKMHPDRLVGKSDSEKKEIEDKFKEINDSYDFIEEWKDKKINDYSERNSLNLKTFDIKSLYYLILIIIAILKIIKEFLFFIYYRLKSFWLRNDFNKFLILSSLTFSFFFFLCFLNLSSYFFL